MPGKLASLPRAFARAAGLYVVLLLFWAPVAWWLGTVVVRAEAAQTVADVAARRAERLRLLGGAFADRWQGFKAQPEIAADAPAIRRALLTPTSANVGEADRFLAMLCERSMCDAIWVLAPDGKIVLASDVGEPDSLLGRSLAGHDFFAETLKGHGGRFFGYGTHTGKPGFYFSAPILNSGHIAGVAVAKIRIETLDALFVDPALMVTDQFGVIVMGRDHALLWHTLPGAGIDKADRAVRASRYGALPLKPLPLEPVDSPLLPDGLFLRAGSSVPQLFLSQGDAGFDQLTLHMLVPLPELSRLATRQWLYFTLIGGSGALALALVIVLATYLRHVRRLGRQLARANRKLQRQADSDFLTGCANRRKFERVLGAELGRGHRYGNALTVAIIDIDFFKRINDSYGHPVGDAGLVYLVKTVAAAIRDDDLLGRIGGEEFALMLPQTDAHGAEPLLQRLRTRFEQGGFEADGQTIGFTVSIGYASAVAGDDIESLLKRADEALYAAKQGGRNRVCFGEPGPAAAQPSA
ncbi:hypothetical protein BJP62_08210 [Jeongeupia sp. USM3]|nr:hypothetical protein BJP62_08210 [Jeongeupia sp. USM3]